MIGKSEKPRLIVVVHRETDYRIRLISAGHATAHERKPMRKTMIGNQDSEMLAE